MCGWNLVFLCSFVVVVRLEALEGLDIITTMENLQDKKLVMLVAPSAMGKSTIVHEVLACDARFGRVRSFTTRPPRADDAPEQFFIFLMPS